MSDVDQSAVRERILERFTRWLDEALAQEEPPSGIAPELFAEGKPTPEEDPRDLYSLWAAATALTQEIKLQGRAFKELSDTLGPGVKAALEAQPQILSELRATRAAEIKRAAWQDILDLLLDLRDRLQRGLSSARAHVAKKTGLWERLLRRPHDATEALVKGYELTLVRLNEALERNDVHEIACAGLLFDPHRMRAVEMEVRPDVPDGTVLEVYRAGYEWNGDAVRPAEVKVARGQTENDHGE
ncbi:MAG: nucleotide exchange factor GrpE [Planctomycetes bacterium]|nr:nucleotide exchange factor GrpE [Planctomycetota bacterium]